MKILVTGGGGFIGSAIVERLLADGHTLLVCGRQPGNLPLSPRLTFSRVDFNRALSSADWAPLLDDVDAVVNCAGILRENRAGEFERIHHQAPLALADACLLSGIRRFVQISALGHPDDGEFISSKHRFDRALRAVLPEAWVMRPSVVVSLRGSYGGTSMLRALAALPGLMLLPAGGSQRIQPILLEDLAGLVAGAIASEQGEGATLDVVGPDVLTVAEYLRQLRAWLKLPPARFEIDVPSRLVGLGARLGDWFRAGPMGSTLWRMLQRGNVAENVAAVDLLERRLNLPPASIRDTLGSTASFVQDRWHARLYLLRPLLWIVLVTVWLGSALSGFQAQPSGYGPILGMLGVAVTWQAPLVLATSLWNLVLGLALLLRVVPRPVLWLMLLSVLAYTLGLGLMAPAMWLDLTGGLLKNLAVIIAVVLALILEDLR